MKVIDADKLPVHKAYCVDEAGFGATFYVVDKEDIDNAPTIDAVQVVRCKDCEHRGKLECPMYAEADIEVEDDRYYTVEQDLTTDYGFCDRGEKKSDD